MREARTLGFKDEGRIRNPGGGEAGRRRRGRGRETVHTLGDSWRTSASGEKGRDREREEARGQPERGEDGGGDGGEEQVEEGSRRRGRRRG